MDKTYYYVSGNTAEGFVNYLSSNIKGLKQIVVLKHPSHTFKTSILKNILTTFVANYDIEMICSTFGKSIYDGVIIREKSLAFITDNIVIPNLKAPIEVDLEVLSQQQNIPSIQDEQAQARKCVHIAYKHFEEGLQIHDDLEKIYIKEMDFNKADILAEEFISKLLNNVPKQNRISNTYHRLFGTNTADGAITVVPNLIGNVSKRCYVKGRAGTGKSVFMRKVARACENKGLDIELYHCSFDPHSIDMVRVRELDFCMLDSTDPHEFFPEKENDVVIDLYEETVTFGTDEKFAPEIREVNSRYKTCMKKGIEALKEARVHQKQLEQKYPVVSEEKINEMTETILMVVG